MQIDFEIDIESEPFLYSNNTSACSRVSNSVNADGAEVKEGQERPDDAAVDENDFLILFVGGGRYLFTTVYGFHHRVHDGLPYWWAVGEEHRSSVAQWKNWSVLGCLKNLVGLICEHVVIGVALKLEQDSA